MEGEEARRGVRVRRAHVELLSGVGAQVEQLHLLPRTVQFGPGRAHREPAVRAPVSARLPEQRLVRNAGRRSAQVGIEIHPVERHAGFGIGAGHCQRGGGDVEADHHRLEGRSAGPTGGPGSGERYPYAALEQTALAGPQRPIVCPVPAAAVVAQEKGERVFPPVRGLQRSHDAADVGVQRVDHPQVGAPLLVLDVAVLAHRFGGRLQRGVRRVVGEVQEERFVAVSGGELDRAVGEGVGEVAGKPGGAAAVVERQQVLPERGLGDVDAVVVVAAAGEAVEVVEADVERMVYRRRAEMPLPNDAGAVTGLLQVARYGRYLPQQFGAESSRVAAGHERRARRNAERVRHVPVAEDDAGFRDPIEMRRLDFGRSLEAHVAVAQVVGQDHQDVRTLVGRRPRRPHLR